MNAIPFRAVALLLLLWLAAPAHAVKPGDPMPTPGALANIEEGAAPVDLSRLRGKVVYVDFWASWCVPCRASMPVVDELHRRLGPRGFTAVGINKDDRVLDAQRFLKRVPVTFPLAADTQDAVVKAFSVTAMPSGYLVDRKGIVRKVHRGYTAETAKQLEREVEELLKEAP
ncbi:MAG TPA: TlpA disulfide reductase family protein [Usitatibacter sp.]|nr:TlpA disulfide reductase family protein [Usitatibacter sp.]